MTMKKQIHSHLSDPNLGLIVLDNLSTLTSAVGIEGVVTLLQEDLPARVTVIVTKQKRMSDD